MKNKVNKADVRGSGIYMIANTVNNKLYIGSARRLDTRFAAHRGHLKRGTHHSRKLQNFVIKYGIETLSFSLLETCAVDQLLEREQFYINSLNGYGNGFNMTRIASSRLGVKSSAATVAKRTGEKNSKAKVTSKEVLEIRKLYLRETAASIGARYGITGDAVFRIVSGINWRHLPLVDYTARAIVPKKAGPRSTEQKRAASIAQIGKRAEVLTEAKVIEMRATCKGQPLKVIAEAFGISVPTASNVMTGKTWKHLPL